MNLEISYSESASLYVIIRDTSGKVWNGATLETWINDNFSIYHLPLISDGGDLYSVVCPSLPQGNYTIQYFLQDGSSPALTDLCLKSKNLNWNGTGTPDTTTGLNEYALISLDELKRKLRMTTSDNDDTLVDIINEVSNDIEEITHRKFLARDYTETYFNFFGRILNLKQYPVNSISNVQADSNAFPVVTQLMPIEPEQYILQDYGCVDFIWPFSARRIIITYNAGYSTVPYGLQRVACEMAQAKWNKVGQNAQIENENVIDENKLQEVWIRDLRKYAKEVF